jgi:hypothetical protein
MTLISLQALSWGTVTGAVVSALLLASGESALPDWPRLRRAEALPRPATVQSGTSAQRSAPAVRALPVSETLPQVALDPR